MHTFGTTFQWAGVTVAALNAINGIKITSTSVDNTTHSSPGAFTEALQGILSGGDASITGFASLADTTGQQAMLADMLSRTSREFIITSPLGVTWTATGFLTECNFATEAPIDGNCPFSATIKHAGGVPVLGTSATAGMSALAISGSAVITPTFAIGTFDYTANVLTAVTSVTFTPTSAAGTITIVANGVSQTVITANASSAIALGAAGSITVVTTTITQTGKTPKVYTVRVVRGV